MKKEILLLALALGLSSCIATKAVAQDSGKAKKIPKEHAEQELSRDTVYVLWVNNVVSDNAYGISSNIQAQVVDKYGLQYIITGTPNDYLLPFVERGDEVVVRRFMKLTLLEPRHNGGVYDAKEAHEIIENLTAKRMKENWLSKQKNK